ncbi:hypothetical protein [Nocardioides sp. InS609-2]|uniref:hypothetical protein n=1 Tax=Nocardioides sp. InS609-2 TaxID=2760705 RepID=UPI0020C14C2C|nr:hypothetical protein [Nocardioides sp. InS609-2]
MPVLLLAAPVGVLAGTPAQAGPGPVGNSERASAETKTVYKETFESGTKSWSTNARAKLTTVAHGRKSDQAARLRTSGPGAAVARTRVAASDAVGANQAVTGWLKSTRGTVRAALVVREVEPATGQLLTSARDRVKARDSWGRAKVEVVRTSATSVIKVAVRTKQGRGDRVLLDDVHLRRTKSTTTPPPPPSNNPFPNASNTGVPDIALATYAGPMTVTTAGAVIDGAQVNGTLTIKAPNVTMTRTKVNGTVFIEDNGSLTMSDSTVDGGRSENSAVGQYNLTLRRVEVVGARASVGCSSQCDVQDSWLHGQYMPAGSDWHGDGFLSNGGHAMTLRHNTLACDSQPTDNGGACSAALAAYGDFDPITNLTVDNNLFVSSPAGFCMYAGYDPAKPYGKSAANVKVTNNVFARGASGKCAAFGPVTAVAPSGNGNVFSGNVWENGVAISAP